MKRLARCGHRQFGSLLALASATRGGIRSVTGNEHFYGYVKNFMTAMTSPLQFEDSQYFPVSRRGLGRVEEMASENAKVLLYRAIEACLSEDSIEHQLKEVNACIRQLEDYRNEIPEEMDELQKIRNILASDQEYLSPERELELSERFLTLYISVCNGGLIF